MNIIANDFHEQVMDKVFYPNAAKKLYQDISQLRVDIGMKVIGKDDLDIRLSQLEAEAFGLAELWGLSFTILALAGEAGEAANEMKKIIRGDVTSYDDLQKELADTQNYIVMSAEEMGIKLQDVFDTAIIKADDKNKQWYKDMHPEENDDD